jgi:TetR/AcrR family transcriptional repressor of bet genes
MHLDNCQGRLAKPHVQRSVTLWGVSSAVTPHRRDARRDELAESALRTLGELGYARTSLREIAKDSPFTHGVVHYYFRDKTELIVYCVRQYKARCVTRYDDVVASSTTADDLARGFIAKLVETLVGDAPMHRLWYDLRTQSMFDADLRPDVLDIDAALEAMVWRVVSRYAKLADAEVRVAPAMAYALLDGIFERALLGYLADRPGALDDLVAQVERTVPFLVGG